MGQQMGDLDAPLSLDEAGDHLEDLVEHLQPLVAVGDLRPLQNDGAERAVRITLPAGRLPMKKRGA